MDKYDCHYRKTLRCSLNKMKPCRCRTIVSDNDIRFCNNLAYEILTNGFKTTASEVEIIKNSCGHYSLDQGQHRTCICARYKIPMKVIYYEDSYPCTICARSKGKILEKLKYKLLMNDSFLISL